MGGDHKTMEEKMNSTELTGMFGIIAVAAATAIIVLGLRAPWNRCPPPAVCKDHGKIRRVKRAKLVGQELILLDDVEPGDWIQVDANEYATFYKLAEPPKPPENQTFGELEEKDKG